MHGVVLGNNNNSNSMKGWGQKHIRSATIWNRDIHGSTQSQTQVVLTRLKTDPQMKTEEDDGLMDSKMVVYLQKDGTWTVGGNRHGNHTASWHIQTCRIRNGTMEKGMRVDAHRSTSRTHVSECRPLIIFLITVQVLMTLTCLVSCAHKNRMRSYHVKRLHPAARWIGQTLSL